MLKILYIGQYDTVRRNLQDLGALVVNAAAVQNGMDYDGTVITSPLSPENLDYKKPIIISGNPNLTYRNVNVLVLDENEIETFYKIQNIKTLQNCKDALRDLGIHYLGVSLGKEKIKKCISYNLPEAQAKKINITSSDVAKAKDTLTAILGYIYIKERTLSANAIRDAQVGASLSIAGFADNKNLKDYYLNIGLRK
jgi:hypothetical protein